MSGAGLKERLGEFRNEIRWTIVVLALAALAVVALWPRTPAPDVSGPAASPRPAAGAPVDIAARHASGLAPCTSPGGSASAQLAGATGTCLADGTPADLGSAVGGGPALVNVWATWCPPCRTELPALQAYSQEPGAVRVVGVQVMSDEADGLELLRQLGVRFPSLHDGSNRISAALKLPPLLPASYVVTAAGEVRRIDPPVVFHSPGDVRAAVERTLGAGR